MQRPNRHNRTPARPVPIPTTRIKHLAEDLTTALLRKIPNLPKPVGKRELIQFPFYTSRADGAYIDLTVAVVAIDPNRSTDYVLSGGIGRSQGQQVIVVNINASKFGSDYHDFKSLFTSQLYKVLAHEFTHAADPSAGRSAPNAHDLTQYYNQIGEVRAYLREIVIELEPFFKNSAKLEEVFGATKAQMTLMGLSETWNEIQSHLNPTNRRYILKAISTLMEEAVAESL